MNDEYNLLVFFSLIAVFAVVGLFIVESKNNLTGFVVCGGFNAGDCPQNYQCRQTGMGCGSYGFGRCVRTSPTYTCLPIGQGASVQTAPKPTTVRTAIAPQQPASRKCGVNSFRVIGSCSIKSGWKSTAGHNGAEWVCYNGQKGGMGGRCQIASYWQSMANTACQGRCN